MGDSNQMQAIVRRKPGAPEVLELATVERPVPGTGEVLIRVQAAGINRADVLERQGNYPVRTNGSPVPGLEVAGTIAALGADARGWAVGDAVTTLTDGGGYAEYAVAPAVQLMRWPTGYDAVAAACLPEASFTVWANVFQAGHLRRGETLVVQGGRGSVGALAIALAHESGARVIATSGNAEGCADCLRLGADHALDYHDPALADAIVKLTDGRGADVILDPVGASTINSNIAALAMDGRLVIIGFTGGNLAAQVDLTRVLTRRLVITGSAMRPRTAAEKGAIAHELEGHVWPLLDRGLCRPPLARVFPLAQAADAHRLMEAGGYLGKIVLQVQAA